MKNFLYLLFLSMSVMIASNAAHAASTDYDGKWNGLISCTAYSDNASLGAFSRNNVYTIENGKVTSKYTTAGGKSVLITSGVIGGVNTNLTISGTSETAQWFFNFKGKPSSAENISFTGDMIEKGLKKRDCTMEFSALDPAVGSLAYEKINPTQIASNSQPVKTPTSEAAKSPVTPTVPPVTKNAAPVQPVQPAISSATKVAEKATSPHSIPTNAPVSIARPPATLDTPPIPQATSVSPVEDPTRLMFQGTKDPKRLKELIDSFANVENSISDRNSSKEKFDSVIYQEARVSLAVLNSLRALGLNVYLNKQHPSLKRDLAGGTTLGDGRLAVRALLLDARTRVPSRTLVSSSALTLLIGSEPAKLKQDGREMITQKGMLIRDNPASLLDQRVYMAQLNLKIREILASKGIKLASMSDVARSTPDLEIVVSDWTGIQSSEGVQAIGRDALIITFNAQLNPAEGVESVLRRTSRAHEKNKEHAAFTELVQKVQTRLNEPQFEKLASISPDDLVAARIQRLNEVQNENDRLRQEMIERLDRIKLAVAQKSEISGSIRVYRKGKAFPGKPEDAFCSVKSDEALVLLGLVRSPDFLAWSKIPKGKGFSKVYDSREELYTAITDEKCHIVADTAENINTYMTAIGRDAQFAFNVGPIMNREEAREPFAISLGFDNYVAYEFARKIGYASPTQVRNLKEYGAGSLESFRAAVSRMNSGKYSSEVSPPAPVVLDFLEDEAKGKKIGKSALDYRRAEDKRLAEEARLREDQAVKERSERAKAFPYIAVLSCGMGKNHINVLACFAAQGSSSVDTELRLTNGDSTSMYKAYSMNEAGQERRDGFYIDLRKNYSIKAQNSHGTLILGLKIIDRLSGKVLYEKQAARFDVISVSN